MGKKIINCLFHFQLRKKKLQIGPEKGVTHLATAAIINALWDLWGKLLNKPVWQLLAELEPEQLIACIDFRYLTNVITKEEALELLKKGRQGKEERVKKLLAVGYPCYTTQAGTSTN